MKSLQSKLWAKITALLLLTVFAIVLFFSGFGVLYLADQGGYSNPERRTTLQETRSTAQ